MLRSGGLAQPIALDAAAPKNRLASQRATGCVRMVVARGSTIATTRF